MILKKAEEAGINSAVALRYILAGGAATGINFLARFPLSQGLPFEWAVLGAQGVGFAAGFLFYRTWVFRDAATRLPRQLAAFLGVNLFSTALVLSAAVLFRSLFIGLEIPLWIAEAMAHAGGIACGTAFNFLGHRMLTFARRQAM